MAPAAARLCLALAAAVIALAACGGGTTSNSNTSTASPAKHHSSSRSARVLRTVAVTQIGTLPAAIEDSAVAPLPDGRVVLLGGLDSADTSTDGVGILNGGSTTLHGALPNAQHDAEAAALGASVYVFGGGQFSSYDHILRYDPASGAATQVGTLPAPASDVAVASIGDTAYIFGGYTGADFLDTIVAYTPGAAPRVVAHLPQGLRYAAVAVVNHDRIVIAGGTLTDGASDQILAFDPRTGRVTSLGRLPTELTHSSAVFLDGRVILIGGRRQLTGDQTASIYAVDPVRGAVTVVGHLPQPLSDAAVAFSRGRIIVAGGDNGNGAQTAILALTGHA
jgi:N-acetylneuraminic acid mutarotase